MLGKRGRPSFRRTTSMKEFAVDVGVGDLTPIGSYGGCDHFLSPRYLRSNCYSSDVEAADFLRSCGLCNRRLSPGRDIYMYRGDTAFCSLECREQQMNQDERNERLAVSTSASASAAPAVLKNGETGCSRG